MNFLHVPVLWLFLLRERSAETYGKLSFRLNEAYTALTWSHFTTKRFCSQLHCFISIVQQIWLLVHLAEHDVESKWQHGAYDRGGGGGGRGKCIFFAYVFIFVTDLSLPLLVLHDFIHLACSSPPQPE